MKLIPLLLAALIPLLGSAQEPAARQPRTRVIPPPTAQEAPQPRVIAPARQRQPAVPGLAAANPSPEPGPIAPNVTLHWKGMLHGSMPIDVKLTGNGPEYQTEFSLNPTEDGMPPAVVTLRTTVVSGTNGYQVSYTVGARVGITTSTIGPARNIEYRDILQSGSVFIQPGSTVAVSEIEGKALTLTMAAPE